LANWTEIQKTALARYDALPWPVATDEEWRRTDPAAIQLGNVRTRPEKQPFRIVYEPLAPELIHAGVILTDLETARKQFPQLLERYLYQAGNPLGLVKFIALHQALSTQGLFCYVPDGVQVELPLKTRLELTQPAPAIFPHVLVAAGRGAQVTLIDERRSAATAPTVCDEMVEIFAGEGSTVRMIRLQQWDSGVTELFTQRAVLEKDAQFLNIQVGLGGLLTKANVETILTGPGGRSELLGILFGSGRQHFDVHTLQDHQAPNTFSDLLYKSALAGQAKSIYTGLIRIAKQAQKSNAYQANRNLLLSSEATADSVPMLEIEADDVRCTHGVAVGPVDEEQAFYLTSRGIPPAEAERLIVEGFFEQVFRRIPLEDLREQLMAEVNRRLTPS